MTLIHASCVEFMGSGLLICGRPGSGKSDLCLRLIDAGAKFVSDDQTVVENRGGKLTASAPDSIKSEGWASLKRRASTKRKSA